MLAAVSARSITDAIDYHALDADHLLAPPRTGDGFAPDEWEIIQDYARIRGTAAHILAENRLDKSDPNYQRELSSINEINDAKRIRKVVSHWTGASVRPPKDNLDENHRDVLLETLEKEAKKAAHNTLEAITQYGLSNALSETVTFSRREDIPTYAAKPDYLCYISDKESNPLPECVCTAEVKTAETLHGRHVVQAEAQRQAVASRLTDDARTVAIIIRAGPEFDDWETWTSLDDDWPGDVAWDAFLTMLKSITEEGRVRAALERAEHDLR